MLYYIIIIIFFLGTSTQQITNVFANENKPFQGQIEKTKSVKIENDVTTKTPINKDIRTSTKERNKQILTTTNAITKNIITTEKLTTNAITKEIITTEKLTTNKIKSTTKKIINKPMSPADIFSQNITSNSIILAWKLSINNNTNNSPKGYNIINTNTNSSFNTNTTIFTITNLTACTKYCFTIQSYNDAGFSPSINKCFNTKSPNLSSILLSNIPSQYLSYRNITWQYLGLNVCSIKYQLQYGISPYFNNTITTKESFYNITNLTLNVNYTIRVRAISENETDNGSKEGQFSNIITFLTTAKSAIPENISLIKSGVDHLELKWDKPITNVTHGPPESCIIKYNNSQTKNTTNEQFIKIDNLKECSKYCFTIQCYNLAGWSPKSANYCHFTKSPKLSNITLSNIENGSNQSRRISWKYSTNNCPIKFEIEISNKNNNTKQILLVENQLFYNINNLTLNEIYLIKIRAKTDIETQNGIKEGPFSNIVEFNTGENQIKVNNFTHKMSWKERKLEIYWQIEEKYFQAILYYIVKIIDQSNNCLKVIVYYCLNNNKVQQYQLNKYSQLFDNCPRNNSKYFNGNLTIFKDQIQIDKQINKYNLQIIAINLVGKYNIVDTINIELKKPAIPGTISLETNDLNNIKLSWKKCIEDGRNGDADGYEITNTNTSSSDNTTETIAIFYKLNQCSTYCFTIKSYNDAGMSSPSIEQCFTTKSPKLSGINLSSIASEYKSSRIVQWKYLGTENCPIKYQLQYWINNSNQIKNNKLIETTQSKYEIKQLELNNIYAINIRAMRQYNTTDGSIYGQFSDNIEFYTGSENIFIDKFDGSIKWSDKMLSISWNIGDQYKDAILYYIVKILDESNNICFNTFAYKCEQCSRIHNNIDENYLKNMPIFSGNCRNKIETFELFKGNEIKFQRNKTINTEKEIFNIEIYGVNLRGLHKILNQSIEASPSKPAPPEDIIPINITSSYIHLSWPASIKNSANSAAKGYSILQSNNNNNNETQNTTNTKIKINNLKQCTKYCFIIYSYNTAGMSQPSKEKCFHTKSPKLSNIILSNISSEYRAIRNISWRYLGKEICPIKYQIKYSNYNIQQINYTNNQFYELTNLNLNDIYWIKVRPISELETDDGGIEGPWSNKVTFYTIKPFTKAPDFINISTISYFVTRIFDSYKVKFTAKSSKARLKIKCSKCKILNNKLFTCKENQIVPTEVTLTKNKISVTIPFNISCKTMYRSKNIYSLRNINYRSGITNASLWWTSPFKDLRNYIIYLMNSNSEYTIHIINNHTNYLLEKLQEKSWYQICIATINEMFLTSKYRCINLLTDSTITGPITSIKVSSTSNNISINWSPPLFKQDIPQGYIILINGALNECQIFIINITNVTIPINEECPNKYVINYPLLHINIGNLSSFSMYKIKIYPFVEKKKSVKQFLSVKTKEGESDSVKKLKITNHNLTFLSLTFNKPMKTRGKIINYKVKIINTKTIMCSKINDIIQEYYLNNTNGYINKDIFNKCGSYSIFVSAVNGWNQNGGMGKNESVELIFPIVNKTFSTVDIKSILTDKQEMFLKNITNDQFCPTLGFIVERRNKTNDDDCLIQIISRTNCLEIRNMVNKFIKCSNIKIEISNKPSIDKNKKIFQNYENYQMKIWIIKDKIYPLTQ